MSDRPDSPHAADEPPDPFGGDPFAASPPGSRLGPARVDRSTPVGRRALGLDGTADGWMAVVLADGAFADAFVTASTAEAVARGEPTAVGVDIPVGLVDEAVRDADAAARRLLVGATSTVFNAPPRVVVEAWHRGELAGHAEASELARAVAGAGITQQAWRLVPKIAEVDELAGGWGDALRECHPELAFRQLSGGERLPRKRSWDGLARRRALLAAAGVDLPDALPAGGDRAAPDDVVDAAVCAWVAAGLAHGAPLQPHPPEPTQTDGGRPIAIWTRPPPSRPTTPAGDPRREPARPQPGSPDSPESPDPSASPPAWS